MSEAGMYGDQFSLQLFSFQDLQEILEEIVGGIEPSPGEAAQKWQELCQYLQNAVYDAYLYGPAAKEEWGPLISTWLDALRQTNPETARTVQITYITFLDRVYNAIIRNVLRHVSSNLCCPWGTLSLHQVNIWRYGRVRETEHKTALEQIIELIYQGGPRFEMEFCWQFL